MGNTIKNSLSVSIACSLLFALVQAAQCAEDSKAKLAKADGLMKAGKVKPAVALLREVTRTDPDNVQGHMQLGAALAAQVEKDEYETAILEEQQALKLDPKSFGARIILGHIYANMTKSDDAIKLLKEACEINPKSYGAHRDLGIAYLTAGKIDESMAAFKTATELKPNKPEAHLKLSILLSKKGNYRDAIAEANEAVQLSGGSDPESHTAEAHLALANITLESGDAPGSVESFKSALRANKDHNLLTDANATSGLGWALASNDAGPNSIEEGVMSQRKAIKTFPPFLPAYVRLAELLIIQGKNSEAEASFKSALEKSPDDATIGTSYAKFLDYTGRKEEARAALKKILEKSPHYKPASDALVVIDQSKSK